MVVFAIAGMGLFIGSPSRAASFEPSAGTDEYRYAFCSIGLGSSTELKEVYSSVFRLKAGINPTGVQNSFHSYVSANFNEQIKGSALCFTTIDNYQEAENMRNDYIGRKRRNGWTVYTVNWAYRGD